MHIELGGRMHLQLRGRLDSAGQLRCQEEHDRAAVSAEEARTTGICRRREELPGDQDFTAR